MKRIAAYIVLFIFLGIYFISVMNPLMKRIAPVRYNWNNLFGADNYKYGDLYGLSYLPEFKIKDTLILPPVQRSENKNIDFYCICDSYVWSFPVSDSVLYGVNKYFQSRWNYDEPINNEIDTSKINFLLIEMSERNVRSFLSDSSDIFSRIKIKGESEDLTAIPKNRLDNNYYKKLNKIFSNEWINKNLEFNLFDYSFLTPVRELKARINYNLFDRVNSDVVISKSKDILFYKPTIDTNSSQSSFKYLSKEEENRIITFMGELHDFYIKKGFKFVFFSIIPNPVSLLEPDLMNYNNLILKIQGSKNWNIPFIDAYSYLKNNSINYYKKSDSHWNINGFMIWLELVNNVLKKVSN